MTPKQDLAQERTDWAEDRTILANERTFAAWMRTGLACIVVALALKALFGEIEPFWIARAVATSFVIIGIFIFWLARQSCAPTQSQMEDHAVNAQTAQRMNLIAYALSGASAATGIALWFI